MTHRDTVRQALADWMYERTPQDIASHAPSAMFVAGWNAAIRSGASCAEEAAEERVRATVTIQGWPRQAADATAFTERLRDLVGDLRQRGWATPRVWLQLNDEQPRDIGERRDA